MTRTCDLLVRSQTLYPTELRARRQDQLIHFTEPRTACASWRIVRCMTIRNEEFGLYRTECFVLSQQPPPRSMSRRAFAGFSRRGFAQTRQPYQPHEAAASASDGRQFCRRRESPVTIRPSRFFPIESPSHTRRTATAGVRFLIIFPICPASSCMWEFKFALDGRRKIAGPVRLEIRVQGTTVCGLVPTPGWNGCGSVEVAAGARAEFAVYGLYYRGSRSSGYRTTQPARPLRAAQGNPWC
jgi:hypothetical protein